MCAQAERGRQLPFRLASLVLAAVLVSSCTGNDTGPESDDAPSNKPSTTEPSHSDSPTRTVVRSSLAGVDTADLPRLPASATGMPRTIPRIDAPLPSLLDDLPGRAAVVINPEITTLNSRVQSWSEFNLLFFGVDGRWRRLNMGDLGLPESALYTDTVGSGELSADGRWWAGPVDRGIVALNLATGETHLVAIPDGLGAPTWVPGRDVLLTNGVQTTVPDGVQTDVPYSSGSVGHEPDGTPLSLERGADGEAVLIEWRGSTRHPRTTVMGVSAPRHQINSGATRRVIAANQLSPVYPTRGQFAVTQSRGRDGLVVVVADSKTGEHVAELSWTRRDVELFYDDTWLDEKTLLVATAPHFVAWRPATGKLFRVTDAPSLGDYWDISVAPQALAR